MKAHRQRLGPLRWACIATLFGVDALYLFSATSYYFVGGA